MLYTLRIGGYLGFGGLVTLMYIFNNASDFMLQNRMYT